MNKRQKIKRDKLLYKAIKELNEDALEGVDEMEEDEKELVEIYERIRRNPTSINQTMKHYRKYILNR